MTSIEVVDDCASIETTLDRESIKEARKERNRLKKIEKKAMKEKQRALQLYEQSIDKNVTIISRDFADKILINNGAAPLHHTPTAFAASDIEFPTLDDKKHKQAKKSSSSNSRLSSCSSNGSEKARMQVNINDLLELKAKPITQPPPKHCANLPKYAGNELDSSRPERKRGKHRENSAPKRPSALKRNILLDKDNANLCSVFKPYTDHLMTSAINDEITIFLKTIVKYQENLYKRDPIRGKSKRRYVVGFHEVKKSISLNRAKLVIIAPDIKVIEEGTLDSLVKEIIELAKHSGIPYLFSLKRRQLSKLLKIAVPVSCIAINNYESLEEPIRIILQLLEDARGEQKLPEAESPPVRILDPCSQIILRSLMD